jgi:Rhodopirellula transposase DDE domain
MATNTKLPEAQRYWWHVLGTLNEAQARVFVAQKALEEGRGGVSRLARLTGMSRPTILKGMAELEAGRLPLRADKGRIRAVGGGRKRLDEADPHIKGVLARLVEASTAGDPMSYLLWSNKSTRNLADELVRQGYRVSHVTVARCLRELGYSDTREYEPGRKISDEEMRKLRLKPHRFHGDWNYTLEPRSSDVS